MIVEAHVFLSDNLNVPSGICRIAVDNDKLKGLNADEKEERVRELVKDAVARSIVVEVVRWEAH